ncbi:MAG: inactive transglutaminase family protein [Lentisphaeria bacterium]|nr:inactive transglutaminase family protein [Lentisphaeria bacterium]
MSAKVQSYICFLVLVILGVGICLYKIKVKGMPFLPGEKRSYWLIEGKVKFQAEDGPVEAMLGLPAYYGGYTLLSQDGAALNYGFNVIESDYSRAIWSTRQAKGQQTVYYRFSIYDSGVKETKVTIKPAPFNSKYPFVEDPEKSAAEAVVEAAWRKSATSESFTYALMRQLNSKTPSESVHLLLSVLTEDYTKTQLLRDLIKSKGIKAASPICLKLEDGKRGITPVHYLVVMGRNGLWLVFDCDDGVQLSRQDMLIWHDKPFLDLIGAKDGSVKFSMLREERSANMLTMQNEIKDDSSVMQFSLFTLPAEYQAMFKVLLVIPVGILVVVICRNIIGLPTSGTFMPILLAMVLQDTGVLNGIILITVVIAIGLLVRGYLSKLNLLLVPRIACVVIFVVLLISVISVVSFKLNLTSGMAVAMFPMIIVSWTVERMSVIWEEQGAREVYRQGGGSFIVAIISYYVMSNNYVSFWTFNFPELLLVLMGAVILLGTYTGYRLIELIRFEPLVVEE